MSSTKLFHLGAALMFSFTLACSDDGSEGGADGTAGTAETSGTATTTETGGETMTGDGDGDPATTTGDGDGDPTGDGDGDPTTTGDGDGDPTTTGDGDGDPTTGDSPCFMIEEQGLCDDDPECQSVVGTPLKQNGPDAPCFEPQEFIGCIPSQGCGDAETWFCVGGNAKPYLVPDTCGPQDGMMCDAPVDGAVGECP